MEGSDDVPSTPVTGFVIVVVKSSNVSVMSSQLAGRYQLEERLAQGGMGSIWRALDHETGQPVAVKLLRTDVEQATARFRFSREVRALARLEHPGIVRIRDYGEDSRGSPFYVMDLLDGRPLSGYKRGTFPIPLLLHLMEEVLDALAFAHARGVVHRDLKPENIILTRDAVGKFHATLVDFGIASVVKEGALGGAPMMSMIGNVVVGTPEYMAPEQVEAKAHLISPVCDLYAIGIMLFEYVAGEVPFLGKTPIATATLQLTRPVPALVSKQAAITPRGIEPLIRALLQKDPWDRPRFAAEVRAELAELRRESEVMREQIRGGQATPLHSSSELDALQKETGERNRQTVLTATGAIAAEAEARPGGGYGAINLAQIREDQFVGFSNARMELWRTLTNIRESGRGQVVVVAAPPGDNDPARPLPRWLRRQAEETATAVGLLANFDRGGDGLIAAAETVLCCRNLDEEDTAEHIEKFLKRHQAADPFEKRLLLSFVRPEAVGGTAGGNMLTPHARITGFARLMCRFAAERPVLLCFEGVGKEHAMEVGFVLDHLANELDENHHVPIMAVAYCEPEALDDEILSRLAARQNVQLIELAGHLAPDAKRTWEGPPLDSQPQIAVKDTGDLARTDDFSANDWVSGSEFEFFEEIDFGGDDSEDIDEDLVEPDTSEAPARSTMPVAVRPDTAFMSSRDRSRVLGCAVVLGPSFSFDVFSRILEGVGGVEHLRADQVWQAMIAGRVWVELGDDRAAFADVTLRHKVLDRLRTVQQDDLVRLHRMAAEVKRDYVGDHIGQVELEVAEHLVAAGDHRDAMDFLLEAARAAIATGQDDRGRRLLEFAARLVPELEHPLWARGECNRGLGIIELRSGRHEQAAKRFRDARNDFIHAGDLASAALCLGDLAEIADQTGLGSEAAALYGEAASELDTPALRSVQRLERARLLAGQAAALCHLDDFAAAQHALAHAEAILRSMAQDGGPALNRAAYVSLRATTTALLAATHLELGRDQAFARVAERALSESEAAVALSPMLARAFALVAHSADKRGTVPAPMVQALKRRAAKLARALGL